MNINSSANLSWEGRPPGSIEVLRLNGRETLSAPYRFDLLIEESSGPIPAIGATAQLLVRRESVARAWKGVIASIARTSDVLENSHRILQIRLVSRTWLLGRRTTSRIFQEVTLPEVVQAVLRDHGIEARSSLDRQYPHHEYISQYRETDLAFVRRLMGKAGLFWRHEHHPGADEIVLCDAVRAYRDLEIPTATGHSNSLVYIMKHGTLVSDVDKVSRFDVREW
jgi:type VI secretion system secreted protein VgrG